MAVPLLSLWAFMVCYRANFTFLGAFTKLRKATISFVMAGRLFVRPHGTTGRILMTLGIWTFFRKSDGNIPSFIKIRRESRIIYLMTFSHLWQYLAKFFSEWEYVLDKSYRENENSHFILNNFPPPPRKSHLLLDNVEKYSGDRGATNDVTIWCIRVACWKSKATCTHARALAHTPGYPHIFTQTNM
jgi:hypothetical protein